MTAPAPRQTPPDHTPRSLTGNARSSGALLRQFFAEVQDKGPRYVWHRVRGELNFLPSSMAGVWDHAAADADYAAHMVNGSPDEETLRRTGAIMADRLITALDIRPTHTLLELGPGMGRVSRELAPHIHRWYGADVSRKMLMHAADRMRGQNNAIFMPISGDGTLPSRTLPLTAPSLISSFSIWINRRSGVISRPLLACSNRVVSPMPIPGIWKTRMAGSVGSQK